MIPKVEFGGDHVREMLLKLTTVPSRETTGPGTMTENRKRSFCGLMRSHIIHCKMSSLVELYESMESKHGIMMLHDRLFVECAHSILITLPPCKVVTLKLPENDPLPAIFIAATCTEYSVNGIKSAEKKRRTETEIVIKKWRRL